MTTDKERAQSILDALNGMEVVESQGGEDAYMLVDNSVENRAKLNAFGITDEKINGYGDENTFCILALAFDMGFADGINTDGKLFRATDKERAQIIIESDGNDEYYPTYAVSVSQAYLRALDEIERVQANIAEMTDDLHCEIEKSFWQGKEIIRLQGVLKRIGDMRFSDDPLPDIARLVDETLDGSGIGETLGNG